MNRFYHSKQLSLNQVVILNEFSGHHAIKVMRVKLNDELILFNGDGCDYYGKVTNIKKKELEVKISNIKELNQESPLKITLIQSLSSNEKMDWILQKSTELGVQKIQPVYNERSKVKINEDRINKKLIHWHQVVISACEQCYRSKIPQIKKPENFKHYLENNNFNSGSLKLILSPHSENTIKTLPKKEPKEIYVLIGPEGGFSSNEIKLANKFNFKTIKLGSRILRTETAPVSIVSILQYIYGDFA